MVCLLARAPQEWPVSHCLGGLFNTFFGWFYSFFVFLTMLMIVFAAPMIGAFAGSLAVFMRGVVQPIIEVTMRDCCRVMHGRSGSVKDHLEVLKTLHYRNQVQSAALATRHIQETA